MSYPTREQALAAAFAASDVGDEVAEHQADCVGMEEGASCHCHPTIWHLYPAGWFALPTDDPGRIGSELAISGGWPLPRRAVRAKPRIGPATSSDMHDWGVWPIVVPSIVAIALLCWVIAYGPA